MKLLGLTTIAVAVMACFLAVCCCYHEPRSVPLPPSVAATYNPYQDACVISVTHPELRVELVKIEKQAPGCPLCQYWFKVWNQTAAVGTKAYETRVLVVKSDQPIVLNGKSIQKLRLHGFVTDLPPVRYPVLYDEEYFVVEGMCPECLPEGERCLTLIIEYYECAGVRRFKVVCDLGCRKVTVLGGALEPTGGDCCK